MVKSQKSQKVQSQAWKQKKQKKTQTNYPKNSPPCKIQATSRFVATPKNVDVVSAPRVGCGLLLFPSHWLRSSFPPSKASLTQWCLRAPVAKLPPPDLKKTSLMDRWTIS